MRNVDRNIGPAQYRHLKADQVRVTKVFPTLQGEGPFAGRPSTFVRLAGCNRGDKRECEFCDTQFDYDQGKDMTFFDIHALLGPESNLVVITGGEPMMQDNLTAFVHYLYRNRYEVQIESNGDRLSKGFLTDFRCEDAHLVVSPKVMKDGTYHELHEVVKYRLNTLKVLVDARKESPYHKLPAYLGSDVPKEKIWLSPLAVYSRPEEPGEVASFWTPGLVDAQLTRDNYAYAARMCMALGYRLSVQTHLLIDQQ